MKNRIYFLLILLVFSCKPSGNITRTLRFVDLSDTENLTFQLYPHEFSYYVLEAVINNKIDGYYIDYMTDATISPLSSDTLLTVFKDNFYDDEIDVESVGPYLSEANLISLDEISVAGAYHSTNYITFYLPGEATPEGMDKQLCSVSFEDALDVLENQSTPIVWFQYTNADWGWINNQVFQPDYTSSNRLGMALVQHHLSDTTFLDASLGSKHLKEVVSDERFIFSTSLSNTGIGEIYLQDENSSLLLGQYTSKQLEQLQPVANDSIWILPMALAFELHQFKSSIPTPVSENGTFLSGSQDELTANPNKKSKPGKSPFKSSQEFKFSTVERIVKADRPDFADKVINALRRGEISTYYSDSLSTIKPSGEFFDALIIDDAKDRKTVDQRLIEVALVIKEVHFDMAGMAKSQVTGFGLIVPGEYVPEGFDRTLGYFALEDLKKHVEIKLPIRGLPLSSSNIEVVK